MSTEPDVVAEPQEGVRPVRDAALLELRGVRKRWRDLQVLDDVDYGLRRGSFVSLAGANGVGKTTLLRIACGLIKPDAGTIRLDGLDPDRDRREFNRRIALLSAGDRGLYARLTLGQNLDYAAGIALLRGARKQRAIEAALERFELQALEGHRVDRMSMGQRQRARLALTLLQDPDVVLLDEPANSLDPQGIELLTSTVADVVARGGAAIWCSPTGDTGGLAVDEAYVLVGGKLLPG